MNIQTDTRVHDSVVGLVSKKQEAKNKNLSKLLVECKTYLAMSMMFVDKRMQNEAKRLLQAIIEDELS